MSATPSDLDVQRAVIDAALNELHTCMPAEVLRVHAGAHGRQFCDVQPSLQRRVPNENGELVDESLPVVPMVPVGVMQGGGFLVSVPIAPGDVVLLVFAERSLDQWLQTARKGSQRTINPGDVGTHSLEGAIALPMGPSPRAELLQGVHATNLVIGVDGPTTAGQIHITPAGEVLVGGPGATQPMVLGAVLLAKLEAITAWMTRLHTILTGSPINEPGVGSPSALQAALKLALVPVLPALPATVPGDLDDVLSAKYRVAPNP